MRHTLTHHPQVHHIPVEDGKGKPLGRSFRVKLWPTLALRAGQVVSQLVRPSAEEITKAFEELVGTRTRHRVPCLRKA